MKHTNAQILENQAFLNQIREFLGLEPLSSGDIRHQRAKKVAQAQQE